jgi:hypothetical protein
MTRRDWWLGVIVVFAGLCVVAWAVTNYGDTVRYDFRPIGGDRGLVMRIDHHTGQAQAGVWMPEDDLRWHSLKSMDALRERLKRATALPTDSPSTAAEESRRRQLERDLDAPPAKQ